MAMANSKSLKLALSIFFKERGRYPEFEEFRNLVTGKNAKKEKAPTPSETEEPKQP